MFRCPSWEGSRNNRTWFGLERAGRWVGKPTARGARTGRRVCRPAVRTPWSSRHRVGRDAATDGASRPRSRHSDGNRSLAGRFRCDGWPVCRRPQIHAIQPTYDNSSCRYRAVSRFGGRVSSVGWLGFGGASRFRGVLRGPSTPGRGGWLLLGLPALLILPLSVLLIGLFRGSGLRGFSMLFLSGHRFLFCWLGPACLGLLSAVLSRRLHLLLLLPGGLLPFSAGRGFLPTSPM